MAFVAIVIRLVPPQFRLIGRLADGGLPAKDSPGLVSHPPPMTLRFMAGRLLSLARRQLRDPGMRAC